MVVRIEIDIIDDEDMLTLFELIDLVADRFSEDIVSAMMAEAEE